jgi:hypothetical protein
MIYNNLMFMCLKHHIETNGNHFSYFDVIRKMVWPWIKIYVESPYHFDVSRLFYNSKESSIG